MEPDQILKKIDTELIHSKRDTRYMPGAYIFVLNGLGFYLSKLGEKRHVTGQELSRGLLEFAHTQFGPLSRQVLFRWGVSKTDDFGNIVYNLISIGVMGKQPDDRLEDFFNVTGFDDFFNSHDTFEIDPDFIKRIDGA